MDRIVVCPGTQEVEKIFTYVRSEILGGGIAAEKTRLVVTRMPDTQERKDRNQRIWSRVFRKIYESHIVGAQCCAFLYPVTNYDFRSVEAREVNFIFADANSPGNNQISLCVQGRECDRLLKSGVLLQNIPEARDLGVQRFCVHAANFLEIIF